ncbi:hypothetical protein CC2G_013063 [Coprinopsis cinerea AmutBmut pab1-1]|nr:hypothetical protein CC2G_013063 [Coprinopsis cinerea AmutBmut pab1-1]
MDDLALTDESFRSQNGPTRMLPAGTKRLLSAKPISQRSLRHLLVLYPCQEFVQRLLTPGQLLDSIGPYRTFLISQDRTIIRAFGFLSTWLSTIAMTTYMLQEGILACWNNVDRPFIPMAIGLTV